MVPPTKWVPVGKLLREWGVRGQIKSVSFNPRSPLFSNIDKLYFKKSGQFKVLALVDAHAHGEFWLLKFSGIENPEDARDLRGEVLYLDRNTLPPPGPGEIYLTDLEGFKVLDWEGKDLGRVQGFQRVGDSEVMLIGKEEKDSLMIPYESDFVEKTSKEEGIIMLKELAKELC